MDPSNFPDIDHRFRDMRDKMNRDREAFFGDSPSTPSSFFNRRESPFSSFRSARPEFEDFQRPPMGFPSEPMMESRKSSAPPPTSSSHDQESIPIRVIHEKPENKHKYTSSHKTADLPSSKPEANASPRVTRAHSEPPKTFNQRLLKTKIPLGNVSEQGEHNLATSASDSSVPHTESPKTSTTSEPTVRHIPIRVEGRDEPVLNNSDNFARKPSDFYPSGVKVERRAQQPPTTLKVDETKKKKESLNEEPTSPLSPIPSDQPIPMGYTEIDSSKDVNGKAEANQEPSSPQPLPPGPIPMACSPDFMQKTSQKSEEAPEAKKDEKLDPCLQQLEKIMGNVRELEKQLQAFKGDKESKEYRYLDEMLTRNLINLDNIDSAGREDVRKKRKESIQSINRCLSVLESKAKNQAEKNNEILSDLAEQSHK